MDTTTLLIAAVILLIGFLVFELNKMKGRIFCRYFRADGTDIEKWVKAKQRRTEFDDGWYYVNNKRISMHVLDKGIFKLFPIRVPCLTYYWWSPQPIDPKTGEAGWETPEARKNLGKEEDIRALMVGTQKAVGIQAKTSFLDRWLPYIMVIAIVIIGYMIYTLNSRIDMLGQAINVVQTMLPGQ